MGVGLAIPKTRKQFRGSRGKKRRNKGGQFRNEGAKIREDLTSCEPKIKWGKSKTGKTVDWKDGNERGGSSSYLGH